MTGLGTPPAVASPTAPAVVVLDLADVATALDLPLDPEGLGLGLRRKMTLADGTDVVSSPTMATLVWYETASPTGPLETLAPSTTEARAEPAGSSSGTSVGLLVGVAVVALLAIGGVVLVVRRRRSAAVDRWLGEYTPDEPGDPAIAASMASARVHAASVAGPGPGPESHPEADADPDPGPGPQREPGRAPAEPGDPRTIDGIPRTGPAPIEPPMIDAPAVGLADPTEMRTIDAPAVVAPVPVDDPLTASPDEPDQPDEPHQVEPDADEPNGDEPYEPDTDEQTADADAEPDTGERGADADADATNQPDGDGPIGRRSPADALAFLEAEVSALSDRVDRLPDRRDDPTPHAPEPDGT